MALLNVACSPGVPQTERFIGDEQLLARCHQTRLSDTWLHVSAHRAASGDREPMKNPTVRLVSALGSASTGTRIAALNGLLQTLETPGSAWGPRPLAASADHILRERVISVFAGRASSMVSHLRVPRQKT